MIEAENLSKTWGRLHAVDRVSFRVEPGQVLGFLGPNGAGKSTTMKMITGFLEPTAGHARVAGEDVVAPITEVAWMRKLAEAIGRPVTFALLQVDSAPELWRELLDESAAAAAEGVPLIPQVAGRPTGLLSGLETTFCFLDPVPAYQALADRCTVEKVAYLRSEEGRAAIVGWEPDEATAAQLAHAAERTYLLGDPPDY
ncbi:MAG: ATP-binding cassette domain-containing protein, partial [Xanthomonadales bacterium]|nr:ATP-binding cassette domain-containing protein [Xanthomonadales bacterium]